MDKSVVKWLFFFLALCLSIGVPASMVHKQIKTLNEGTVVKVKTRPIDPYDPFRGRYVLLSFDRRQVVVKDAVDRVVRGRSIYVEISLDSDGYAQFGDASFAKPEGGLFLEAKAGYSVTDTKVRVDLPFDRYYMNEAIAPEAERLYREMNRIDWDSDSIESEGDPGNFVTLRVLNGYAAIEGLYLDHQPIEQLVREWIETEKLRGL